MNGTNLVDGTVEKNKFETSVQVTLTNADKIGDLSTLGTTAKDTIVGAINENTTSLAENMNILDNLMINLIPNGVDDTQQLQTIMDNHDIFKLPPNRIYKISSTIKIPKGVFVDFNHATFIPISGGTFLNNFMFIVNSEDGVSWDTPYPGYTNSFNNCYIDNHSLLLTNIRGFFIGSTVDMYNIKSNSLYQTIRIDDHYIDCIKLDRIYIIDHLGIDYAITQLNIGDNKPAQGDSWHISNLQIESSTGNNNNRKLLYLGGNNNNVTIDGVINGFVYLKNGTFSLKNFHIETGNIVIQNARVDGENIILYHDSQNGAPLTLLTDNGLSKSVSFKNLNFSYPFWRDSNFITMGSWYANIFIDPLFNSPISLENANQGALYTNGGGQGGGQGVFIIQTNGSDISHFINNAASMSLRSVFNVKTVLRDEIATSLLPNSINLINVSYQSFQTIYSPSIDTQQGILWLGNSGTYYYKIGILVDYNRKIGQYHGSEFAITVNNTERKTVDINILDGVLNNVANCGLIIYRGTSTGVYNKLCTLYLPDPSSHQIDNYNSIYLKAWNDNVSGTAQGLNYYSKVIKNIADDSVICHGTQPPTYGVWKKGDRIINTTYTVGQVKSWICTVGGVPGTWASEGIL
jgi:hypothetical protein